MNGSRSAEAGTGEAALIEYEPIIDRTSFELSIYLAPAVARGFDASLHHELALLGRTFDLPSMEVALRADGERLVLEVIGSRMSHQRWDSRVTEAAAAAVLRAYERASVPGSAVTLH